MAGDWLEQLEARLEQQLEAFLSSNPAQQTLLQEQEARDRQAQLVGERSRLQRQAEQERQGLLALAGEIQAWRERVQRARSASANELANRAEAHVDGLMQQGRERWEQLGRLGEQFRAVEAALHDLEQANRNRAAQPAADLEQAWARFEAQQELEQLKRRQQQRQG